MFILKQDFQLPDFKALRSTEAQLRNLSDQLEPHVKALLNLFEEASFGNWQDSYKTFVDKQERQIVNLVKHQK